jgi:glycosyltransferase involved in cell wall biosynthesis
MPTKIAHLSSAHPRYDTRIFIKMCTSLAKHGYDVSIIVADGLGGEIKNGVAIIDVGPNSGGRLSRMSQTVKRVFNAALKLDADIYHLHDPELIPIGLKLKKLGKKVIFDAHEDLPKQILGKPYLNKFTKFVLSKGFTLYEHWACPKFDAIIGATPFIRDKFLKINPNTVDINNFPLLVELANTGHWSDKLNEVAYVGDISKIRGIEEILLAMDDTRGIKLNLAGKFADQLLENKVKNQRAWLKVNELGFLNRQQVSDLLAKSKAGLVTLHPVINYMDALPVKMFEYMAAGIPVIASNFPLWREIVEENQCGLCVNPLDAKAISDAIQYFIEHPHAAEKMGRNGRRAIEEKYNWLIEEKNLFALYEGLEL